MIGAVKKVLRDTLVKVGIPEKKIAQDAREEQVLIIRRVNLPLASLITNPGRFEVSDHKEIRLETEKGAIYRQMRTRRVMPVLMKIIGRDEKQAGELVSRFIGMLPFFWEYEGIQGDIEPVREEYSDYESRMNPRYEATMLVEFAVDVGPAGMPAESVDGIEVMRRQI